MIETFLVGSLAALGAVIGLHWIDTWIMRRDAKARRAALLAELGKAPPAPGTMRRRYTDLPDSLPEDGDEGGWPNHRDAA